MNTLHHSISSRTDPLPAIGFTAIYRGTPQVMAKSHQALQRVLEHFDNLTHRSFEIGQTRLTVWGRGNLEDCCYFLPDGSVLVLVGSPRGKFTWEAVSEMIMQASHTEPFILPWEGRVNLLRIDPISGAWTLWNDWIGSIPVFHAQREDWRIASTLEPAVADTLSVGDQDIFSPGLLALLIWGHYFSDWTLFKNMKVVPPDAESCWERDSFRSSACHSVQPSDERWTAGWDELMEEMYVLTKNAIASSLNEHPLWIIPLSSGLDSRLIAGVAAELNANVRTYTWGLPHTSDVIHAKSIARVLGFPWKYLNPGNTYLTGYRDMWADLFGSAMHFHGMYQMPFLNSLKSESQASIISGFIGDCLAGYDTKFLCEVNSSQHPFQITPDGYLHWTIDELRELIGASIEEQFCVLTEEFYRQQQAVSGAVFQQLKFLILWGRQRHFTYFQSMMSDYWTGVSTPYMDRNYARFSFSLPRNVFDNRILQRLMLSRYYPKLAAIPGTYSREPAILTGSYLLKKRAARNLPESLSKFIFPGLYRTNPNIDVQCVIEDGKKSFYPVFEKLDHLGRWMNTKLIEKNYRKIVADNDGMAVRKLQSIQTLAYRLPG